MAKHHKAQEFVSTKGHLTSSCSSMGTSALTTLPAPFLCLPRDISNSTKLSKWKLRSIRDGIFHHFSIECYFHF